MPIIPVFVNPTIIEITARILNMNSVFAGFSLANKNPIIWIRIHTPKNTGLKEETTKGQLNGALKIYLPKSASFSQNLLPKVRKYF